MKKWLRRILIAAALVALTLGILYELSTHVGRGWLRGEAFYEGRPTSYWRGRCDQWLSRYGSSEAAAAALRNGHFWPNEAIWIDLALPNNQNVISPQGALVLGDFDNDAFADILVWDAIPAEKTSWRHFLDLFRSAKDRDNDWTQPHVLRGKSDAESVLRELQQEEKYRLLVGGALQRIEQQRALKAGTAK
jgi:hypothetical protein